MQNYISLRPAGAYHLICHLNESPLTRGQFTDVLAKAVKSLGLPMHMYTSNTFRIGRAIVLALQGVPTDKVKRLVGSLTLLNVTSANE